MSPTFISINPRDCEDPSVDRGSESTPRIPANVPWVDYHVVMLKLHIDTVATASLNKYDSHGWLSMRRLALDRRKSVSGVQLVAVSVSIVNNALCWCWYWCWCCV